MTSQDFADFKAIAEELRPLVSAYVNRSTDVHELEAWRVRACSALMHESHADARRIVGLSLMVEACALRECSLAGKE